MKSESRLLGRTLPELGYGLLLQVVDDQRVWAAGSRLWAPGHYQPGPSMATKDVLSFPLPGGSCERVGAALQFRSANAAFTTSCGKVRGADALTKLKRDLGVEIWYALQVISFNYLATGCSEATSAIWRLRPMQAQRDARARIRTRALSFCSPDPGRVELPRGPSEPWDERCTKQKLSYGGDLVTVPLPLTAAQIEPGLPAPGLGVCFRLLDHLCGDIRWYMADPRRWCSPRISAPRSCRAPRCMSRATQSGQASCSCF